MAINDGQLSRYICVIMRVPAVFIMDEILKVSFGLAPSSQVADRDFTNYYAEEDIGAYHNGTDINHFVVDSMAWGSVGPDPTGGVLTNTNSYYHNGTKPHLTLSELLPFLTLPVPLLFRLLVLTIGYLLSAVWLMLSWDHLIAVYNVVASIVCVMGSYYSNASIVNYYYSTASPLSLLTMVFSLGDSLVTKNWLPLTLLACNYMLQILLYLAFVLMQVDIKNMRDTKGVLILPFVLPVCSVLLTLPEDFIQTLSIVCVLVPLVLIQWRIMRNMPYVVSVILNGFKYAKNTMHNVGLHTLIEEEWGRLSLPTVLRLFWIVRVANFVAHAIASHLLTESSHSVLSLLDSTVLYSIFKATMIDGCNTVLAVLGMTSVVSFLCHYVGLFFQVLLQTGEIEDRSMGTFSAIMFFVLAEQSGLTVLQNDKRYIRLCRNFCLLFTAMMYFVHNMVSPVLLSLSASRNPSLHRHARSLSVCAMLLLLPFILLCSLWSVFSLSTWLLAVSAFSIQVVLKTLVTLCIYCLFLADAHYNLFLDNLDDYVYYIKAFGNTIEFIFGIVLFLNGLWIYCFEAGGALRAVMMCVHAYVNIWSEARSGWAAFIKRRNAVNQIAAIPDATPKQLEDHDDVCTICFQALHSAKITKCKHFYHEVCLRKWLYVQDSCPLCHQTLYKRGANEPAELVAADNRGDLAMAVLAADPAGVLVQRAFPPRENHDQVAERNRRLLGNVAIIEERDSEDVENNSNNDGNQQATEETDTHALAEVSTHQDDRGSNTGDNQQEKSPMQELTSQHGLQADTHVHQRIRSRKVHNGEEDMATSSQ